MLGTEIIEINVPRTLFGVGAVNGLGDLALSFAPTKILIVTDRGVVGAGVVDPVVAALTAANLTADVFDRCGAEAPTRIIQELAGLIRDGAYDLLIGVGGGSTMDTTKAAALLAADPDLTVQGLLDGRPAKKAVARIMVPTTSGTGSEWSSAAVITYDLADGRTYPYFTPLNYPDAVILDPGLTLNLPAAITASTGMDALTHAIEAYTCCRANVVSDMYASSALRLISDNLRPAFAKGSLHMEERYRLSIASASAMLAVSLAGCGLAHFMNHALSAKARIPHGAAVGLMLPYVMEFNLITDPAKFAEVARLMGETTEGLSVLDAAGKSVAAVRRLQSDLGLPQTLTEVGLSEADIPELVEELINFQGFPIAFMGARECVDKDAAKLYTRAL